MTKQEKETIKRYIKSTVVTFLSGFIFGALPLLQELSIENLTQAFWLGVIIAGFRGGIKALAELTIFKK